MNTVNVIATHHVHHYTRHKRTYFRTSRIKKTERAIRQQHIRPRPSYVIGSKRSTANISNGAVRIHPRVDFEVTFTAFLNGKGQRVIAR